MERDISEQLTENALVTGILGVVSVDTTFRVLIGILAGYSIVLLTGSAAIVPPIESVPVELFGLVGLGAALVMYSRLGSCGTDDCGCSGDCETA